MDIKKFSIKGLYNERDIIIPFSEKVKILVAENGYGKTTVLNSLYSLLTGDELRLRKIPFTSLEIEFSNGESYSINKEDLDLSLRNLDESPFYTVLINRIGELQTTELINSFMNTSEERFKNSTRFRQVRMRSEMSSSMLFTYIKELVGSGNEAAQLLKARKVLAKIKNSFNHTPVYLPTYRRVEQDIRPEIFDEQYQLSTGNEQMNFGMGDVDSKIKEITREILSSSVAWFSKINGEMLSQLVEGFNIDSIVRSKSLDLDAVKIVLDRIGNNIGQEQKKRILEMIRSNEILSGHDPLIYFISNLTKVYEQQKENDRRIHDFTEVCNRYLGDKMLQYNESTVTVDIVRRKNEERKVDIENLSSGEKQIISLFARLYLQKDDNLAIFFDEPELSLSMEWQKTLLPDIMNSGKCAFLFTTTHSPFIFENELINNAVDLGLYIKEL